LPVVIAVLVSVQDLSRHIAHGDFLARCGHVGHRIE
jgi:hypothetical protein